MTKRRHLLDRSPRVDRINGWLESAWDKGLSSYPSLDHAELLAKGTPDDAVPDGQGMRSKEDEDDFSLRLERLCDALQTEAQLNSLGRTIAHGQLVRVIKQRHALAQLWHTEPHLASGEIAPPIVVVGQMRSGTTRIHRLFSSDPRHCATRFCDSWHPVPQSPDLRPLWSGLALAAGRYVNPWLDTVHPFGAARADEELGWLASALDHSAYEAQWHIPSFVRWSEARDAGSIYREFARILRTDAASAHNGDHPRVLKVPQFAEDLPHLLDQFPDARLVISDRDDDAILRSSVSLVANQMAIQSDAVDLDWIEGEWTRRLALRKDRLESALAQHDEPTARLSFDDLDQDWRAAIAQAYAALNIELTPEALAAMSAEMRRHADGDHTDHAEQLDNFDRREGAAGG